MFVREASKQRHPEENELRSSEDEPSVKMQESQSYEISDAELSEIYSFAVQLGRQAGTILQESLMQRRSDGTSGPDGNSQVLEELVMEEKMNAVDIVTKTDNEVEEYIHSKIRKRYPAHAFVGEELYSKGSSKEYLVSDAPTWVVDPLDGTVNFTHCFPMFCVSIALVVNQKPVIGVVHAPLLNQMFSACRGKGAWLNETTRLPLLGSVGVGPIPKNAPKQCVFGCEWGKDRRDLPDGNLHRKVDSFVNMAAEVGGRDGKGGMVHGVRSLGSATLDLAYTAMGAFDIWWEGGCWEWDVAAGICLLQEAGGLITTANPPENIDAASIEDAKLGGRLYLAIRPAADGPQETAREGQERLVRAVWRRVRRLEYPRPGA
ncbi:inositol monophosphatase [Exophiala viscosa]|uniref:inositol monophosphatase n=1 Tax=Exophiala viscosa TaxID=2486360 RepID=UPI00218E3939|nr:inositol monophosphatase [Exophiala viscosa]